jgi:hypothetical protein
LAFKNLLERALSAIDPQTLQILHLLWIELCRENIEVLLRVLNECSTAGADLKQRHCLGVMLFDQTQGQFRFSSSSVRMIAIDHLLHGYLR